MNDVGGHLQDEQMHSHTLRAERLRSHRLTAPARSVAEAARHMLAVQAQDFWAGRWALAVRTSGAPTLRSVDRLFSRGVLVRAWTQRGTLHMIAAEDLAWMLDVTSARQLQMAAPRYRELGLDEGALATVERVVRAALRGGNGLSRVELLALVERAGIDPRDQRGLHAIQNLALRGIICQGPVIARPGGVSRDQLFVLTEEHIPYSRAPKDPAAEFFVRYVVGHGPASAKDFAWWAGLTLGAARAAAAASIEDDRIHQIDDGLFAARQRPRRRADAASVIALGSFEEYYIAYSDRTIACPPALLAAVGPAKNGMVRPIIISDGVVVGVWRHSTAVGRHAEDPVPELLAARVASGPSAGAGAGPGAAAAVDPAQVSAALDRYAAFITS